MGSLRARFRSAVRNQGFRAFVSLVGNRHQAGASLDAFRMLVEVGAPPATAHAVLEGWPPSSAAPHELPSDLGQVDPRDRPVVWLAHHLTESPDAHDWPKLIARAVRVASAARLGPS